jgi:hypothetical protein
LISFSLDLIPPERTLSKSPTSERSIIAISKINADREEKTNGS